MELSDESVNYLYYVDKIIYIHSYHPNEMESEIEVVFIDEFQRTHLLTTKTRHLSVSEDTDGAEFYCDENSTLNHQCSHSRFLHIHILKTRSLTYNTR